MLRIALPVILMGFITGIALLSIAVVNTKNTQSESFDVSRNWTESKQEATFGEHNDGCDSDPSLYPCDLVLNSVSVPEGSGYCNGGYRCCSRNRYGCQKSTDADPVPYEKYTSYKITLQVSNSEFPLQNYTREMWMREEIKNDFLTKYSENIDLYYYDGSLHINAPSPDGFVTGLIILCLAFPFFVLYSFFICPPRNSRNIVG